MSTAANATIQIDAKCNYTSTNALGNFSGTPSINSQLTLTTSDISKCFANQAVVATPTTLDVTSGLTDAYGNALVFATVKTCVIYNSHASATLTVGGGSDPLFGTDQYTIKAGKSLPITSPFTVGGSAKNILLTPSASLTYQILIVGS